MAAQQKQIFRQASLDRLASPEELDQLMKITNPKGWFALLGIGGMVVAAILWSIFGTITTKLGGQGILLKPESVHHVMSATFGQIDELYVNQGEVVTEGQVIARISGDGTTSKLTSPHTGRVIDIRTGKGSIVSPGVPLLTLENLDQNNQPLEVITFLPIADGKRVQPGMRAEILPSIVKREEVGFIEGQVISVSPLPVTQEGLMRLVGNELLVQRFLQAGSPLEVRVALTPDPRSITGFKWSSKGPASPIPNGTLASVEIVTNHQRPLSLVIPTLKRFLNDPLFASSSQVAGN